MIVYFTGTGNSRYLAKILAEQLGDELIDAASMIRAGNYPVFSSNHPFVFVSPTYAWRLPRVFEAWIRRCRFSGSMRAYYILNCGSEIGAADSYARTLSKDMGFEHMGMAEILMPENYIAMFSAPEESRIPAILSAAREKALSAAEAIRCEIPLPSLKLTAAGRLYSGIVNNAFYKFFIGAKRFYSTDACISCGKCAENCMLSNISLHEGKPLWGNNCTHCMACICKCPAGAIEYGRHSVGLRRYTCPEE